MAAALHRESMIMATDPMGNKGEHTISLCHEPVCNFLQADKEGLKVHIREAAKDINKWGILLGTIRKYLKNDYNETWEDIIHPREANVNAEQYSETQNQDGEPNANQ